MAKSSPFESLHDQFGANFREYDGWRLPSDYGDRDGEKRALEGGLAAFDLSSFGKIAIKGTGGGELIDRLFPGGGPEKGRWVWGTLKNGAGEGDFKVRVAEVNGQYIVFTTAERRGEVLDMVVGAGVKEVKIADITEKTGMMGIYGEGAVEAINRILPFEISDIGEFGVRGLSFFMMNITVVRGSWVGCDGLEVLCPKSACGMAAGAIIKYHKRENITPAGMDCLRSCLL